MADPGRGKVHSACDQCRTRHLSCTGTFPLCFYCEKQGLACFYSPQKQMGRPRKRRREDNSVLQEPQAGSQQAATDFGIPSTSSLNIGCTIAPFQFEDFTGFPEIDGDGFGFHDALLPAENGVSTAYPQVPLPYTNPTISLPPNPTPQNPPPFAQLPNSSALAPNTHPPPPCACLLTTYQTLTTLQTTPTHLFPAIIPPLRHATHTAATILDCKTCTTQPSPKIQNMLSLTTLLTTIASHYHQALSSISTETLLLETTGQKKTFRLGDPDPNLNHLHTGLPDCPMGFMIELEPSEWRKLAKRAIKTEVFGGASSTNTNTLVAVLDRVEERQRRWHREGDGQGGRMFGGECGERGEGGGDSDEYCVSLRMIAQVRRMVGGLEWD